MSLQPMTYEKDEFNPNILRGTSPPQAGKSPEENEDSASFGDGIIPKGGIQPAEGGLNSLERERIITFENRLFPALHEALLPLYQFVGFLEAESGKRIYYRYDDKLSQDDKKNPLVKGCQTIEEFKIKNSHLGRNILNLIDLKDPMVKKDIGVNIADLYRRYVNPDYQFMNLFDPAEGFPRRLWNILPLAAFQYILSISTYGAIQMAASELQKDLKLLIISSDVNYIFAQFVAKKYISPKQNAFVSGINGSDAQFRIASGFKTSVVANSKWLMACKYKFENDVIEVMENNVQKAQQLYDQYKVNRGALPANYTDLSEQDLIDFESRESELFYKFTEFKDLGNRKVYRDVGISKIKL